MPIMNIYQFTDYREYLKGYFEEQKTAGKKMTQRLVLQKMGITSSGFLANVLSGKNNLTIEQVKSLAGILRLNKNETDYFKYMVYFAKAKSIDEKDDFYETLVSLRRNKIKKLSKDQLSIFTKWYYVVIRELLAFTAFKDDYAALAKMVQPAIKPSQAKQAIAVLEAARAIKKDADGYYRQNEAAVSTGDETSAFIVARYQLAMMDLGREALEAVPGKERDVSGLTLSLSDESFTRVKAELQDFRKRLLQIAVDDPKADRVYRCNFQLFPVTEKKK